MPIVPINFVAIAVVLDDDKGIIVILKRSRIGVGCLVEENSAITDCKYICI